MNKKEVFISIVVLSICFGLANVIGDFSIHHWDYIYGNLKIEYVDFLDGFLLVWVIFSPILIGYLIYRIFKKLIKHVRKN